MKHLIFQSRFLILLLGFITFGISQVWGENLTGKITFGSGAGNVQINSTSVIGKDSQGNEWTITNACSDSYSQQGSYSQVGSSKKACTALNFSMSLPYGSTVTAFNAKFGGSGNGAAGKFTMKIGGETIKTSNKWSGANDQEVKSGTISKKGTLTIEFSELALGVKCYYIEVTYTTVVATPVTTLYLSEAGNKSSNLASGYNVGDYYPLPSGADAECGDKSFVGWSTEPINTPSITKPTSNFYEPGTKYSLAPDNTFYAVYADVVGISTISKSESIAYSTDQSPSGWTITDRKWGTGYWGLANGTKYCMISPEINDLSTVSNVKVKTETYGSTSGSSNVLEVSAGGVVYGTQTASNSSKEYTISKTETLSSKGSLCFKSKGTTDAAGLRVTAISYDYKVNEYANYTTTCETQYNIEYSQSTGGEISGPAKSAADKTITLSYEVTPGYQFDGWYGFDEDLNEIDFDGNTFTMPASNVEIEGNFSCATPTFKTNLSTEVVEYTQDHEATPLVVEANETWDIYYQWQSSTNNTDWSDITNENDQTFTPSTETAGTTYYRCVLINMEGDCLETTATSNVATIKVNAPSVCEDPVIGLAGGEYTGAQSATITCLREGASIYYTTDGNDPSASSTEYTGAVTVDRDMTLKAIAIKEGLTNSSIVSATYTIKYTVTFAMQSHGSQVPDQKVGYDGLVSEPSTTSITGWTFEGWFKEGACTNQWDFATDQIKGHTTLYAKWTMTMYDVKFFNNGDIVQTKSIQEGQTIGTLPTLTSSDAKDARSKTFVGWTEEEVTTWQDQAPAPITSTKVVEKELTLNAVWAKGDGKYQQITSESELIAGNKYVIQNDSKVIAHNSTPTLIQNEVALTEVDGKLTPEDRHLWTLEGSATDGWSFVIDNTHKLSTQGSGTDLTLTGNNTLWTIWNIGETQSSSYTPEYNTDDYFWIFQSDNSKDYYIEYSNSKWITYGISNTSWPSTGQNGYIKIKLYGGTSLTDYITHSSSSPLVSIELNTTKVKANYFVGETFTSVGLSATATLGDGITFPIEFNDLVISTPDLTSAGAKTVTVEYTFNGATKSNTYTVNAYSVTVNSVYTDRVNDESVDGNTYTWTPTTGALKFSTQAHYQFNGISEVVGATSSGSNLSYTLSNPTANVTLTATWQRLFTLEYDSKGGTAVSAVADKTKGSPITLGTTTKTGYQFDGWFDNETYEGTALSSPYTINADATIYAKWSEIMPASISLSPDVTEITDLIYDDSNKNTKKITATINPTTALEKTFTWSVEEGSDVIEVATDGTITAKAAGTAKVKVASTRVPTIYKEISVTVHSLPLITWLNMDGSQFGETTKGTSAGKVGTMPFGTPTSCDTEKYPYFRGWSATNFGKTTDNPEANFVTKDTEVALDGEYTFYAVCAAGEAQIQTIFTETFDKCAGTGGNDGSWSGNIASSTLTTDNTGWTCSSGNGGSKCAKFGAGSSKGSAETPSITMSGDGTIILKAAAWNGSSEGTTLKISATSGTVSPSSVTLKKAEWTEYEITITGVTTATKIKFEANNSSNNRFFIDNVVVKANAITYTSWATQCCTSPTTPLAIQSIDPMKKNEELDLVATGGNGGTIIWSTESNKIELSATGHVKALGIGEAVVTARQEKNGDFCDQAAQITIQIVPASMFGVTVSADEGGIAKAYILGDEVTTAETDDVVTISAEADDDHNFTGWEVLAGGVTLGSTSETSTTFTMGSANVQIKAHFALKQFTITLNAGTGDVETTSYTEDVHTVVDLPDAAHCQPDIWVFQGWSETNVVEVSSTCPTLVNNNYEITKDVTLYAIYKKADGGEKTIGYKISYQVGNTTYYASSGVSQQKMSVTTNANDAVVFGVTTTSGQSKLYQVDENGDAKANTYIYLNSSDSYKLYQGADGNGNGHLWTISLEGTHSIINVTKNDRCIAGRSGKADNLNVVNASVGNVDKPEGVDDNYFHHITLVPVVKGAASYCTSPECVSLTWKNEMSDEQFVTYPADGKLVLPTETPTSCAPGLYSFVGWTTTEIQTYKTSQQEIVTAETAAPEHATTYYAEFKNTTGNRYRTSCPETMYAITYKANGGEGEDYIQYSENKTNVTSYDGAAFSKTDCQLYQWNTSSDGTGTAYKPNSNISSITTIVGEGTTGTLYAQWTGELSVAGNVCLTSGKGIAVYTTAAAGNLITISCPAIDMVHHIRYKFLDGENQDVTTLKLCNNGTENYNQITNIATDALTGAYEQTFSICYTPTEYNQAATYTLLLEGVNQGGTTIFNSCTLSVTVRSLPEQFVIAVKRTTGDNRGWYAVPNVLATTASAAPDALSIEVDDNNNPTCAWLSDNTTAALYKSASRYEANQHRGAIRFQSVANNNYITTSTSDNTNFYMKAGNDQDQQFYLNSTNGSVYYITLDPAGYADNTPTRWICMNGTKIGWYKNDNETKNVYFLPVKAITEEIEVTDGQVVNLSDYEVDETTTIIVHAGGILNADKVATIGTLQIERKDGKSGQVFETATLTANNAYFDLTINASGMKWYDIAVPFTVDRLHGLSFPNGGNFPLNDVLVYNGATRAANGTNGSAWEYQDDGDLVPGVGYDIMFATNVQTVRFTKKADAQLNNEEELEVSTFVSSNQFDANWNYIANNTLHYVNLGFEKEENKDVVAQTYVPVSDSYTPYAQNEATYLVGTPFFVQVAAEDFVVWGTTPIRDILRAPAMTTNKVERFTLEMSANGEMTDRLFVSADENARDEYQIGKDVAKMGVSSTVAQMWINNYNSKLCANEAVLSNGQATYQLGVFVPKDGEYTIAITSAPENATLYLTIDGQVVWNLSESAYVANLTKGTHNEFGLMLIANERTTPTNINGLKGNNKAQKIFKDYNIYILRDAQMYNTQGVKVQ